MNGDITPSDGLIDRLEHLKDIRWSGAPLEDLDERGRRLYFRGCDLSARLALNGEGRRLFEEGAVHAACSMVHAERYLADRLAYELAPWPKGMLKDEEAVEAMLDGREWREFPR